MLVSRQADVSGLVFIVAHLLFWLLHLAVWACWQVPGEQLSTVS